LLRWNEREWNNGGMECWNNGLMECWNTGTEEPELALAGDGDKLDKSRGTVLPPSLARVSRPVPGFGGQRENRASRQVSFQANITTPTCAIACLAAYSAKVTPYFDKLSTGLFEKEGKFYFFIQ